MNKAQGFTLVEMIIVITLTTLLTTAGMMIFSSGIKSYFTAENLNSLTTEADQALQMMVRELRAATEITSTSPTTISFVNDSNQTISYQLNGSSLNRSENGLVNQYPLSNHVNTLSFNYYDPSLATTATLADIRLITISLNLVDNNNQLQMIQTTYLRNLS